MKVASLCGLKRFILGPELIIKTEGLACFHCSLLTEISKIDGNKEFMVSCMEEPLKHFLERTTPFGTVSCFGRIIYEYFGYISILP